MTRRRSDDLQKARELGTHTPAEWFTLIVQFDARCAYCAKRGDLTKDHVLPIRWGGSDAIENIVPACGACNSWKHDYSGRGLVDGVPRAVALGIPLAEAELVIEAENERAVEAVVEVHQAFAAGGDPLTMRRTKDQAWRARQAAEESGVLRRRMRAAIEAVGLDPHEADTAFPPRDGWATRITAQSQDSYSERS